MDGKENGYLPAHPIPIAGCNDGGVYNALEQSGGTLGGLTKRELFAAMAMQGFLANKEHATSFHAEDDADYCVKIADALLAELAKDPT